MSSTPYVVVKANLEWVHLVLVGKSRDADISSQIVSVMALAKARVEETLGPRSGARDALGLSDSDEGEGAGSSTSRGKSRMPLTETTVTVRGCQFRVVFARRIMHVAATSEDLASLLKAIETEDEETAGRKHLKKSPMPAQKVATDADGNQDEKGKVTWWYGRRTWRITYMAADGKIHTVTKDLAPPLLSFSGDKMSKAQYEKIRQEFRQKAVKLWNEKDCSGDDRLEA